MRERLPEDIDAERVLLTTLAASGTLDPGSQNADAHQAVLAMHKEYFVHPAHKAVCKAIKALYAEGLEQNCISLKAKLGGRQPGRCAQRPEALDLKAAGDSAEASVSIPCSTPGGIGSEGSPPTACPIPASAQRPKALDLKAAG